MKIIKKVRNEVFTEKDLTDMYAEKVLNDSLKDKTVESGYISYLGKVWKNGDHWKIATYIFKNFDAAYHEHTENKIFCSGAKASENCYYCAFFGKILKKGVVCLIDAYVVEN